MHRKYVIKTFLFCFLMIFATSTTAYSMQLLPITPMVKPTNNITLSIQTPTDLKASSPSNGIVKLTWKDNASNEKGYLLERKQDDGTFNNVALLPANTSSYQDNEASLYPIYPGNTYTYRVRAYSNAIYSEYSNDATVTVKKNTIPNSPTMLIAHVVASDPNYPIQLTWNESALDERSIVVQRSIEGGNVYTVATLEPDTHSYIDNSPLEFDTPYVYRVKITNAFGSSYSNDAKIIKPSKMPNEPTSFTAIGADSYTIKLQWNDNADNEDCYKIVKLTDGAFPSFDDSPITLPANTTHYDDNGLEPEKEYRYLIKAYNELYSTSSVQARVFTGPFPPKDVKATETTPNQVKLTWECASILATDYAIYRKEGSSNYTQIATLNGSVPFIYMDTAVSKGKTYTYSLKSFYGFSPSVSSNEAVITVGNPQTTTILPPHPVPKKLVFHLGSTEYSVNGVTLKMDIVPTNVDGRVLVPIRYVSESLGATTTWDGDAYRVIVELNGTVIELWIGNNTATVNGIPTLIDPNHPEVTPIIVPPGRVMVPLRFIAENLGCTVDWDSITQKIIISLE